MDEPTFTFKKAFANKNQINKFKEQYSSGKLETKVISNVLQPFHKKEFPEIEKYCNFWWPKNSKHNGLVSLLNLYIVEYGSLALYEAFGKHDFIFKGNRTYKNYVLEFEGLNIIVPDKRSFVLSGEINKDTISKLIKFENHYTQFVLDCIYKNLDSFQNFNKQYLLEMEQVGFIDKNHKVNLNFFENKNIPVNKFI